MYVTQDGGSFKLRGYGATIPDQKTNHQCCEEKTFHNSLQVL